MGILADCETFIQLKCEENNSNHYENYLNFIERERNNGKNSLAEKVRYAIGISYNFNEIGKNDSIMFIGSMGVLGNIESIEGTKAIEKFRNIHDLDILLRNVEDYSNVGASFDEILFFTKSNNIPNKYKIIGKSYDANCNELGRIETDISFMKNDNKMGFTNVAGAIIDEGHWEEIVESDFFGIKVSCAPPFTLLEMKLSCNKKDGNVREQDCEDILNLIGILERKNVSPEFIKKWLPYKKNDKLKRILLQFQDNASYIIESSKQYRRSLSI